MLDEPTSALDPTARAEIIDLLIRLQRELGTAYLFISHDLSTVRFLSHRVAVLYLGTIVEEAPAEALFAQPRHPYSLGLLASVLLPDPTSSARTRSGSRARSRARSICRRAARWPGAARSPTIAAGPSARRRVAVGAASSSAAFATTSVARARPDERLFRPVPGGDRDSS